VPNGVVVLASGQGTLLQAILDSPVGSHVLAVGSDLADCSALTRAESAGIPTFCVPLTPGLERAKWDEALTAELCRWDPEWIVCAGFMRILGPQVLDAFPQRIINSHPALLPAFAGAHAVRDALAYGSKVTGTTVHLVDAGVDTGPIIAQQPVMVQADDDESSLHERIKDVERVLLVEVVQHVLTHGLRIENRRVIVGG
jgi:phosphoribosylglycinamide formyltransferase-1